MGAGRGQEALGSEIKTSPHCRAMCSSVSNSTFGSLSPRPPGVTAMSSDGRQHTRSRITEEEA